MQSCLKIFRYSVNAVIDGMRNRVYNELITGALPAGGRKDNIHMSDTKRNEKTVRTEKNIEEMRARLKEKLYKARAAGELTEDDEELILAYAQGVVDRRKEKRGE